MLITTSHYYRNIPKKYVKDFLGGHSEKAPPVPIPNTEVKLFSADGTAWETVWESRSPPILIYITPIKFILIGVFAFVRVCVSGFL